MSLFKSSSRYNSFDSRSSTQSHQSDPSSSIDLQKNQSSLKSLTDSSKNSSRAIMRTKSTEVSQGKVKQQQNFNAMVKQFMDNKSSGSKSKAANQTGLIVPADFIAEDLKKNERERLTEDLKKNRTGPILSTHYIMVIAARSFLSEKLCDFVIVKTENESNSSTIVKGRKQCRMKKSWPFIYSRNPLESYEDIIKMKENMKGMFKL